MEWLPMETAPRNGSYIVVVMKDDNEPMVVFWDAEFEDGCWWLPEGASFKNEDLVGWSPIPIIKD